MRETLLKQPIVDVVYYTYSLIEATLAAAGDCTFVSYVLLADASCAKSAATPKELARVTEMSERELLFIADYWESEGLLERTRSPLDGRLAAFTTTLLGDKHVLALDALLCESFLAFWRCDEVALRAFVDAVKPFQRHMPRTPFADGELRIPLRALCALHALADDYRAFAHSNTLTFSELHLMLSADYFGVLPNHAIYQDRNQFALSDLCAVHTLQHEKGHLAKCGNDLVLSQRGVQKTAELHRRCDAPTRNKASDESGVATRFEHTCRKLTRTATAQANDAYGWGLTSEMSDYERQG